MRTVKQGTLVLFVGSLLQAACAQNIKHIVVPEPNAPTAPLKCGVRHDTVITRAHALCIAKVSGLESGVNKWQMREFSDHIDVFNTTATYPLERGVGVRIRKVGGSVLIIEKWESVTVR
jgi:hypothetical protein